MAGISGFQAGDRRNGCTVDMIEIAKATDAKSISVMSAARMAQKIKEAQQEGYDITAETCSHYLSLTDKV
ncbi:hypothetical protein [Enterocloster sp.]|uniref:hypothetical protein n=1 Tax=Enterocloster sp. TaxID=2719315 RepID=UPI0039A09709